MSSFRGTHTINLDAKGRIAMPKKFQMIFYEHYENNKPKEDNPEKKEIIVVITMGISDNCLVLYPLHEWTVIENKLKSIPNFDANVKAVQRLLLGHAEELSLDSHDRILIPSMLREQANFTKKIVILGLGNKLELWSLEDYSKQKEIWFKEAKNTETSGFDKQPHLGNLIL